MYKDWLRLMTEEEVQKSTEVVKKIAKDFENMTAYFPNGQKVPSLILAGDCTEIPKEELDKIANPVDFGVYEEPKYKTGYIGETIDHVDDCSNEFQEWNSHKTIELKEDYYPEHEHEKVYDNVILCSYPAQRRWICKTCGEVGYETIGEYKENEFNKIYEEFNK